MEMSSRRELDLFLFINGINSEDPYRVFTWKVTYGDIYLLGVKKQFPFSTAAYLHLHPQCRHCLSTRQRQPHSPYFWAHVIIVLIGVDGNVYYPTVQWCHFFAIGDKKRFVCHIMQLIYLFAFSDTKDVFNDLKGRRFGYTKALATSVLCWKNKLQVIRKAKGRSE
ncbi:hypothetical protein LXL04_026876 [Taraxacum kok-saghyz]